MRGVLGDTSEPDRWGEVRSVKKSQPFVVSTCRIMALLLGLGLLLSISGCAVGLTAVTPEKMTAKMFPAQVMAEEGRYEEACNYLMSNNGRLASFTSRRIISENVARIRSNQITDKALFDYRTDFKTLIKSLIELGRFREALAWSDRALRESAMFERTFQQYGYTDQHSIVETYEFAGEVMRLKGYAIWFLTGNEQKARHYFDQSFSLEFAVKDKSFLSSLFQLQKTDRAIALWDRAVFTDKVLGQYDKSLKYFQEVLDLSQKFNILALDQKYGFSMQCYIKMMLLHMKAGNLEEAKKTLDQYHDASKNLIYKLGHALMSSSTLLEGYVATFDSSIGALYALLRDFRDSKAQFDKAKEVIGKLDVKAKRRMEKQAIGTYYVFYGTYYLALQHRYKEAIAYVDKGLPYLKPYYLDSIMDDLDIETAYIYSGKLHFLVNDLKTAMSRATKAIDFARRDHNVIEEASARTLLGRIHYKMGKMYADENDYRQAAKEYKSAYGIVERENVESTENWRLFYGLGQVFEHSGKETEALKYYLKAVNEVEKLWDGRLKNTQRQVSFIDDRLIVFEPVIRILHAQGKDEAAIHYIELSKARTLYETSPYYSSPHVQSTGNSFSDKGLDLTNIRKDVPPGTAILEYYMGQKSVFGAVITRRHIYLRKLKKVTPKDLQTDVIALKLLIEGKYPYHQYETRSAKLYSALVEPFTKYISGKHILCIIPHGVLHYLPYQALLVNKKKRLFLIDRYKIFYAPNLTMLDSAHKSDKHRKRRLLAIGNSLGENIADLHVRQRELGPLRYAPEEINEVSSMFAPNDRKVFINSSATESMVRNIADGFDIILFSTHGILLRAEPLKSCIFLSQGRNGRLTVAEIERLTMRTNLVVLSACESGLVSSYQGDSGDTDIYDAKFSRGDDLAGLQRAFMKAGVSSVLSTLWRVNDKATKSLIVNFFKNYEGGYDKVSALRKAELTIKSTPQWNHPYYWSSFILSGDWR